MAVVSSGRCGHPSNVERGANHFEGFKCDSEEEETLVWFIWIERCRQTWTKANINTTIYIRSSDL